MAKKPAGQPGDIVLSNGTTYNPVTQQSGTTWKVSGPQPTTTWVNPDFDWSKAFGDATADKTPETQQPPQEDPYTKYLREEQARLERLRTMNARAIMEGQMAAYGLGSLAGRITGWITDGYEPDAIMALVRQSDEYAARFPAMKALQAKNRSITESEYIAYEQSMAGYERLFGLPSGMLTDKNMVTKLLTNEISAREVEDRATKAAASMYSLPQEFRDTMRRYYGVDSGGLTGYFLDPDVAAPLLERQYVSAQIGMEGGMQGIGVAAQMAEELYQYGVDRGKAREGFGRVSEQGGLSSGKGDTASQDTLIKANLTDDKVAQSAVVRAGQSRVNRFAGGGGFATDKTGVSGLGNA